MNILRILRTIVHLRPKQILFQILNRLRKVEYRMMVVEKPVERCQFVPFIPKYTCYEEEKFSFLNISSAFVDWNDMEYGMLWAYNLNYMDWILQDGIDQNEACKWIDRFIDELPTNRIGLDPYPTALRCMNWMKFITQRKEEDHKQLKKWNDSLYAQICLLERKLEYHLLGNHLLENAYAWFVAAIYFNNQRMYEKSSRLLLNELKEQILPDGAHYERSPMYHCILLDRLLDCYNFAVHNERFDNQNMVVEKLKKYCEQMLGHLESIIYADMSFPLFNDATNGIAPTAGMLMDYAGRLGLTWKRIPMGACGYRKLKTKRMEAFVDVGNIMATYQPGHAHAGSLSYELRIDGRPIVVDTGISTYNKTARRQYERSTTAHNTVGVKNRNSSEVWGGFRVGRRAEVQILEDNQACIDAIHDGYRKTCRRKFEMNADGFRICDEIATDATSFIHLWHEEHVEQITQRDIVTTHVRIHVENAKNMKLHQERISIGYNRFLLSTMVEIDFKGSMNYKIEAR